MNTAMLRLLSQLRVDEYQSGQALAKSLNVSRTMIWKTIKQLQELGVEIDTQQSIGYKLAIDYVLLDAKKILQGINRQNIELNVLVETASTNAYLSEQESADNNKSFQVCLAEWQSKGKGRQGRKWVSPFGANLYLSIKYRYREQLSNLYSLSPLLGLVCVETLATLGIKDLQIKWPNDIYLQGKKLGGILVELKGEFNSNCEVVIGLGLNVNMRRIPETINQEWTSLQLSERCYFDRNVLAAKLITAFIDTIDKFDSKSLANKMSVWCQYDRYKDKGMTLSLGKEKVSGVARGISDKGELLLQLVSGETKAFSMGEIETARND